MHAAIAVPGNSRTILTHLFGRGLEDDRYVFERFRSMAETDESALLGALELVGRHEGIRFRSPPRRRGMDEGDPDLTEIQRVSGVRARKIRLDDRWWLGDSGALLAFRRGPGTRWR